MSDPRVLANETCQVGPDILEEIVKSGEGIPRDCIKLLEQIIPLIGNNEEIISILKHGVSGERETEAIELCRMLTGKYPSWKKAIPILNGKFRAVFPG